jgi:hypothetical protein
VVVVRLQQALPCLTHHWVSDSMTGSCMYSLCTHPDGWRCAGMSAVLCVQRHQKQALKHTHCTTLVLYTPTTCCLHLSSLFCSCPPNRPAAEAAGVRARPALQHGNCC